MPLWRRLAVPSASAFQGLAEDGLGRYRGDFARQNDVSLGPGGRGRLGCRRSFGATAGAGGLGLRHAEIADGGFGHGLQVRPQTGALDLFLESAGLFLEFAGALFQPRGRPQFGELLPRLLVVLAQFRQPRLAPLDLLAEFVNLVLLPHITNSRTPNQHTQQESLQRRTIPDGC